ncbi:MAG: transposase, partial [Chloroflexota bacterium]|nr:transposase [Chloroflexota bacterium]
MELTQMFPDDAAAEKWFVENRWPNGVGCVRCGSLNIQERKTRKPQPYRCRDCRKDFSAKVGTVMQGSNLGYKTWVFAIYFYTTGIKGVSSMKLSQKAADRVVSARRA